MTKVLTISACAGLLGAVLLVLAAGTNAAPASVTLAPPAAIEPGFPAEPAQIRWFERRERQSPEEGQAFLGVTLQELDDALRAAFDFDGPGVLVNSVVEDSPADDARLRAGDIITHFDGDAVDGPRQLRDAVVGHGEGPVEIDYIRRGRARSVEVDLRARGGDETIEFKDWEGEPAQPRMHERRHSERHHGRHHEFDEERVERHHGRHQDDDDDGPRMRKRIRLLHPGTFLGVRLESLSDELAAYFDVEGGAGVLVIEVVDDSPAEEAGIRAGDVITHFDGRRVSSPAALRDAVREHEAGERVRMQLVRRGETLRRSVELAEHDVTRIFDQLGQLDMEDLGEHLSKLHKQFEDSDLRFDAEKLHELHERLNEPPVVLDERLARLEEMIERLGEELEKLADRIERDDDRVRNR